MRDLRTNEQFVMLAIMRLAPSASAPAIQSLVKRATDKRIPHGTLYVLLQRLEDDGLVQSSKRDSYSGGRPANLYFVTPQGRTALDHSLKIIERLRQDIGVQSC